MYHSIDFVSGKTKRNTWDDWHLIPTSRPFIAPPAVKTSFVEIPGGNGALDLTESLAGRPLYQPRSGSWEFIAENGFMEWSDLYSAVMMYLHGRSMRVVLEDDPAYYYTGRLSVTNWRSDKAYSAIAINYALDPFKRRFLSDSYQNMKVEGSMKRTVTADCNFLTPPTIEADQPIQLSLNMTTVMLEKGINTPEGIFLQNGANELRFEGNATVSVHDLGGRL